MTTSSTSLKDAMDDLHRATEADGLGDLKTAYDLYVKALGEFNKQLQRYYERATVIKEKLNPESTTTHTAEVGQGPADSRPKLRPVRFSDVKLNDVSGLEVCKEVLREATIWPKKYPHFFTGKLLLHHCGFSNLCF
uniref:MIT domain-containing protein n=1 Tax=Quercus lobata TaxID=97700 RepID=A0A7N2LIJ6_QUELO